MEITNKSDMSKYCFYNPSEIVEESFSYFLNQKNYNPNNVLNSDLFNEWNFLKDLEERSKIDLTSDKFLNTIPYLGEYYLKENKNHFDKLNNGTLVKFNCMIQNIFENQLFMSAGFDSTQNNKLILNKFFEYDLPKENGMLIDDEEDLCSENNIKGSILSERLSLNCVLLPGLSPVICKELYLDSENIQKIKKKKIIVYDYVNSSHKVNEEIFIIGVAYDREKEIIIHSWKIVNDYIQIKNLQNAPNINEFNFKLYRDSIFNQFKSIFNNNELLSEYLVLFLTSQIFSRVGTHFIGKLSLNIINQKETINDPTDYFAIVQNFIQLISNFTVLFSSTIKSLNSAPLYPRFDVNTEELIQGFLQTPKHTFLLIDERQLNEGKLDDIGCKNYGALKNLVDLQVVNYEYPYSNYEIESDCQILTISDKIKSIFNSNQLIEILFENDDKSYDINLHMENLSLLSKSTLLDENITNYRHWFNLIRYSQEFSKGFQISDEVSGQIQKDFVERKEDFTVDDLDCCMKLARLYAISIGRNELLFSDYKYAKDLEYQRKQKLLLKYKKY
jgi:hypothetical protein